MDGERNEAHAILFRYEVVSQESSQVSIPATAQKFTVIEQLSYPKK